MREAVATSRALRVVGEEGAICRALRVVGEEGAICRALSVSCVGEEVACRRSCASMTLRRRSSALVVTILAGEEVNSDMQSACGDESS